MKCLFFYLISSLLLFNSANTYAWDYFDKIGGYSGEGRWYISASMDSGHLDQNLTETGNFDYVSPRFALGGVGAGAVRFDVAWSAIESDRQDWRISGLEADFWLPWEAHRRIRPYLILGAGYFNYYGKKSEFFDRKNADNTARSYHAGFALTGNLTLTTELDLSVHYRFLEWDATSEEGEPDPADATTTSTRLTLRQLF